MVTEILWFSRTTVSWDRNKEKLQATLSISLNLVSGGLCAQSHFTCDSTKSLTSPERMITAQEIFRRKLACASPRDFFMKIVICLFRYLRRTLAQSTLGRPYFYVFGAFDWSPAMRSPIFHREDRNSEKSRTHERLGIFLITATKLINEYKTKQNTLTTSYTTNVT